MKVVLYVGSFLLLAAFVLLLIAASRKGIGAWPFYAKRVLSDPEQVLYWRLIEALPGDVVLAQVQLSRFLGVKKGHKRMQWLNRINQKSADFVVCRKDFSVLAVIELDDSTHARPARQRADADKQKAVADAGVTLLRWTTKKMPSAAEIRAVIYPPSPARLATEGPDQLQIDPALAAITPGGARGSTTSHNP